ncbi:PREDICTED: glucan endo-1,3-beta-glucosidase 9 [Erythranthe guttata]|uniref:glucan endo-1,3-beta-glucosidase 9 n=1 Tax=Erythranthe guttata TaxID=4155 RepID=UPI00064D94F5|nr:PREDICTED: glucan endo-1,3-beta-glucosidase 9 [Erythranthe guttata]|eukprot:XP_012839262.1 PREDICTED: glucan endo-1,3-beta-glucosidase 9 [Erythranthe guttata]
MPSQYLKSTPIPRFISLLLVASLLSLPNAEGIGVNWGTAASHPLPPHKVVELLKSNGIAKVKLSDADPLILQSLSGSNIRVTVGIPNSMLRGLNSSLKAAESWVHDNLTRFVSDGASRVLVDYVAVGEEPFLQTYGDEFHPFLVGAATNIQAALFKAKLSERVKVVTPCSFDAFTSDSNPLSKSRFRPDVNKTMLELVTFLNKHQSPFFVTVSPFQSYIKNKNLSLDFALFRPTPHAKNSTRKTYKNLFDLSYNTVVSSLSNSGFPQMEIVIGQIGWPTDGSPNATSSLAEEFTKGLINHLHSKSAKPSNNQDLPTEIYILSLLDEDQRNISTGNFERHWGVFTFDGQAKYQVDLGQGSKNLANARDVQYLSSKWCVVNNNKDLSNASALALEACGAADCTALSLGGSCFNLSWPGNISYAFNSYYQQRDQNSESCDFGGLGLITSVDPSDDACRFSIGLRTSSALSALRRSSVFCWIISPAITMVLWLLTERL